MKWLLGMLSVTGFNFAFWALMGVFRMLAELSERLRVKRQIQTTRTWQWLVLFVVMSFGFVGVFLVNGELTGLDRDAPREVSGAVAGTHAGLRVLPEFALPFLFILSFSVLTGYLLVRLRSWATNRKTLLFLLPYVVSVTGFLTLIILTESRGESVSLVVIAVALVMLGVIGGTLVAEFINRGLSDRLATSVSPHRITPADVAVILAAHNEALTIGDTLGALLKMLPKQNIFVGSDASTDATVSIVRNLRVSVLDLQPNRGKAKTLVALLEHFNIFDRFKAVMVVDADIVMSQNRMEKLLPMFDDPTVAATVGRAVPKWFNHWRPRWNMFVTAYRIRVWRSLQYGLRMGQTWKYMNVTPIIPGGSSIYRSSVLRQLQIDAPGLEIEDFNMTFEVHHKKLGRVVYNSAATIIDQEPFSIHDFIIQVKRWYLGFWQTVWRHGFWPSWFWFTMAFFTLEMYTFSLVLLVLPVAVVMLILHGGAPIQFLTLHWLSPGLQRITVSDIFIGIFLIDYAITVIIALFEKKPVLMLYGLGFVFLRYLDGVMFAYALPLSLVKRSHGQWTPPKRQAYSTPAKTGSVTRAPAPHQ